MFPQPMWDVSTEEQRVGLVRGGQLQQREQGGVRRLGVPGRLDPLHRRGGLRDGVRQQGEEEPHPDHVHARHAAR